MHTEDFGHLHLLDALSQKPGDLKAPELGLELPEGIVATSSTRTTADGVEVGRGGPGSFVHGVRLPAQREGDCTLLECAISTQG
jgi:hypothetical protein